MAGNPSPRRAWLRRIAAMIMLVPTLWLPREAGSADPPLDVTAVVLRDFQPLYSLDERKHPTGFAIDILDEVAREADLRVRYLVVENWKEAMDAVRDGRGDFVPGYGIRAQHEKDFAFTSAMETIPVSVFVRSENYAIAGPTDLGGQRVAVVVGGGAHTELRPREEKGELRLVVAPNIETALFKLLAGEADAFVFPRPVLEKTARLLGMDDHIKAVGRPFMELTRGYLLRKDKEALLRRLDPAIRKAVASSLYGTAYAKWYGKPIPYWTPPRVAWAMGIVTLLAIGGLLAWRHVGVVSYSRRLAVEIEHRKKVESDLRLHEVGLEAKVKERTENLNALTERLESILSSAGEGILGMDAEGRISFVNPAATKLLGWSVEEFRGNSHEMFHHTHADGALFPTTECPIHLTSRDGVTRRIGRDLFWRKDGSGFPVEYVVAPLREGDRIAGAVVVFEDITERKKVEEALLAERESFKSILDAMDDGVYIVDRDCNIEFVNHVIEEQFGPVRGRKCFAYFHGRDAVCPWCKNPQVFAGQSVNWEWHSSKTGRTYDLFDTPLRNPDGSVSKLEFFHDITDRKKAEEELRRSTRDLQQFAHAAAHDLQEPLRAVVTYTQLLHHRHADKLDDEAREAIGFAVTAAKTARTKIADIQAYMRLAEGDDRRAPVDADAVLAGVLEGLKFEIAEKNASVTLSPLPAVMGDGAQLALVFRHLVENGLKFHDPAQVPVVTVSAEEKDGECVFSVTDNGLGIAPEYHDRIFGVFKRLHSQEEYPGTGMGLAICKKIVERHGGRIWVESQSGKGSTFRFTLPSDTGIVLHSRGEATV
jgi:PAS domain S-box-containing protein